MKRKMKTQLGEVEISVPRDRNGENEPKIIDKYQRILAMLEFCTSLDLVKNMVLHMTEETLLR